MIFLQAHLFPEKCWPSFRPNPRYLVTGFFVDPPSFLLLRFLHRSLVDPPKVYIDLYFAWITIFFLWWSKRSVSMISKAFQSTPSCRKYFLYHPIWFSIIDCIESFGSHPHKKKISKSKVSSSKPLFFPFIIWSLISSLVFVSHYLKHNFRPPFLFYFPDSAFSHDLLELSTLLLPPLSFFPCLDEQHF